MGSNYIIVLGNSNVGKTTLISRYIFHNIPRHVRPTMEFKHYFIWLYRFCRYKAFIWDTPGRSCNLDSARTHIGFAHGALIVYDIHNRKSYEAAQEWVQQVKATTKTNGFKIALVGNKIDVAAGREVSTAEAKEYATKHELLFEETSAMAALNDREIFQELLNQTYGENLTQYDPSKHGLFYK